MFYVFVFMIVMFRFISRMLVMCRCVSFLLNRKCLVIMIVMMLIELSSMFLDSGNSERKVIYIRNLNM